MIVSDGPPTNPLLPFHNLQRVLDALPTSLATAVESAVGQLLHPQLLQDVVSTVNGTLSQQRTELEHAALQDLDLLNTTPSTHTLIAECFDHHKNPGLVNWIREPARQSAIDHVSKLREYMVARLGNNVRTEFQRLISLYMDCLQIPNQPSVYLNDVCVNLRTALHAGLGGVNSELDDAARSVNRACYSVREITNKLSHQTRYGDADVYELCGAFQALGAAIPTIATEFYSPPPPPPPPQPMAPDVSTLSSFFPTLSEETLRKLVVAAQQSADPGSTAVASVHHTTAMSPPRTPPRTPARGWEATGSQQVVPPPRPRTPPTIILTATAQPTRFVPTQAELEAAKTFQLYYNRPAELPKETDKTRTAMFKRTENQMTSVPKATLCDFQANHDAACVKAHSYLEVMSYNPLYKLFVCQQTDHFWGSNVVDNNACAGIHVNTGINHRAWLDAILSAKSVQCRRGAKCRDSDCFRSHSLEEACWFNPKYKITKCKLLHCTRPALECRFAHENEQVRHWNKESDYVGKPTKVLFIERTHTALARALETLRYL